MHVKSLKNVNFNPVTLLLRVNLNTHTQSYMFKAKIIMKQFNFPQLEE